MPTQYIQESEVSPGSTIRLCSPVWCWQFALALALALAAASNLLALFGSYLVVVPHYITSPEGTEYLVPYQAHSFTLIFLSLASR